MIISSIICTRNRAKSLHRTLAALARFAVPVGVAAQVLVVDNRLTDEPPRLLKGLARSLAAIEGVALSEPRRGKQRARNHRDRAGNAEVIDDGVTGFLAAAPTVRRLDACVVQPWQRSWEFEQIDKAAAQRIRKLVAPNPSAVFASDLLQLAMRLFADAKAKLVAVGL